MLKKIGIGVYVLLLALAAIVTILWWIENHSSFLGSQLGGLVDRLAQTNVSLPVAVTLSLLGIAVGYGIGRLLHPLRLKIVGALYGVEGRTADVAAFVRKHIKNDRASFVASNENLGGDPCPAVPKKLYIAYTVTTGKPPIKKTFEEGNRVELPE